MSHFLLLTCEHAGNIIPEEYAHFFAGEEEVLYSHKAIDLGGLRFAKHVAKKLERPLHYTTISRLIVETNRSPDNKDLFSEYVIGQSDDVKKNIMNKYYWPYRNEIENEVKRAIENNLKVLHVAFHTFAPVMEGKIRTTDIGLLYDPERSLEKNVVENLVPNFQYGYQEIS